jgi:hypothetical protein
MKKFLLVAGTLTLAVMMSGGFSGKPSQPTPLKQSAAATQVEAPPPRATMPLEQKLASINAGHSVSKDDVTVARFRFLLNDLHEASSGVKNIDGQVKPYPGDDPERIADLLLYYHKKFREEQGSSMTLLELAELLHQYRNLLFNGGTGGVLAMALVLSGKM